MKTQRSYTLGFSSFAIFTTILSQYPTSPASSQFPYSMQRFDCKCSQVQDQKYFHGFSFYQHHRKNHFHMPDKYQCMRCLDTLHYQAQYPPQKLNFSHSPVVVSALVLGIKVNLQLYQLIQIDIQIKLSGAFSYFRNTSLIGLGLETILDRLKSCFLNRQDQLQRFNAHERKKQPCSIVLA